MTPATEARIVTTELLERIVKNCPELAALNPPQQATLARLIRRYLDPDATASDLLTLRSAAMVRSAVRRLLVNRANFDMDEYERAPHAVVRDLTAWASEGESDG